MRPGDTEKTPRRGRFFSLLFPALLLLAPLYLLSCSSNDPEIMQVDVRIQAVLSRETGTVREDLVVFLDVHDPDGIEDVGWVTVEMPEYGLGWQLEGDDLVYLDRGEEHWFGAAGLTAPGLARVPRGALVRLTVGDLGGRTTEREVRIPGSTRIPGAEDFPLLAGEGRLVKAAGGVRHFLHQGTNIYHIRESSAEGSLTSDSPLPFLPLADIRERLGEEPFYLLAEGDSYLLMVSGPWIHSEF